MKIKYFAWIREITNHEEENIDSLKINDLNNLKVFIIKKYPSLKKHLDNAVNQEYVVENIDLNPEDEIAVFPPVSGG